MSFHNKAKLAESQIFQVSLAKSLSKFSLKKSVIEDDEDQIDFRTSRKMTVKQQKAHEASRSKFVLVIAILLIVNYATCVAYSAVAVIFPVHVTLHGLSAIYSGLIIDGYPFAQMTTFTIITSMMNNRGKKVTLLIGCLFLGITLVAFGLANSIPPSQKYVFFAVCIVCRFFIGFGSACIGTSSYAIIASNYPDQMAMLIAVLNFCCSVGMISGTIVGTTL